MATTNYAAPVIDMEEVVVRVKGGNTYHRAIYNRLTDRVYPPRTCYIGHPDKLTVYPSLPDEAQGIDLCLHCYPIGSDR